MCCKPFMEKKSMVKFESPMRLSMLMEKDEAIKLQKVWTRSGDFANRSQYIRAAVNAFAGETVFKTEEVEE